MKLGKLLALALAVGVALVLARSCARESSSEAAKPEVVRESGASVPDPATRQEAEPEPSREPEARVEARLALSVESWPEREPLRAARIELVRGSELAAAAESAERAGRYEAQLALGDWLARVSCEGFRDSEVAVRVSPGGADVRVVLLRMDTTLLRARSSDGATLIELARGLDQPAAQFVESYASLWWSRDGSEELRALVPLRRVKDTEPYFEWVRAELDEGREMDLLGALHHADGRGTWLSLTVGPRSGEWIFVAAHERDVTLPFGLVRDEFRRPDVVLRVAGSTTSLGARAWLESLDPRRAGREPQEVPAGGVVRFEAVEPGEYFACVAPRDGVEERRLARVRLGRDLDLGTWTLAPSATLEVVLLDEAGRSLPALVQVGPFDADSRRPQGFAARGVRTDTAGVARVELGGGDVALRARVLDGAPPSLVGHESAPLLVLGAERPKRIELRIAEPARVGIRGSRGRLAVLDGAGIVVDGTVELGAEWGGYLQPGSYRAVDWALTGEILSELPFSVRSGDERVLDLR
jgi:hypothetical protein